MPQKPALDTYGNRFSIWACDSERCDEINEDIVVIACVDRYVVSTPGGSDGPYDIQRLIPVERRDLDRYDILYLSETLPQSRAYLSSKLR